MKIIVPILNKVLVKEFYRSNASFFLLVVGLGAGFMRSSDHIALAEFFVSSPLVVLIPVTVWILYGLKVIGFNLDLLTRNENGFLYYVPFLPAKEQWIGITQVILLQLIPMLLYGAFLMTVASKNGMVLIALLICLSSLIIIILSSTRLLYALYHPHVQKNVWLLTRYLNASFAKPYFLFFPEWIVRNQPLMMIGTKIFSCVILFGVSELYKADQYDLRLFGMGTLVAFSANINLMWELHRFDNFHLNILRNLPLSFMKRAGYFLLTTTLLLIPELTIVVKQFPAEFNTTSLLSVILFGESIPVLFYGCLYSKNMKQDQLMTIVFFIAIALIVMILFEIPLFVLALANFCVGLGIWKVRYYTFEQVT